MYHTDDAAHYASQTDDTDSRHEMLDSRETISMAETTIEQATYSYWYNGYDEDVQKHAYGIYCDDFSCS